MIPGPGQLHWAYSAARPAVLSILICLSGFYPRYKQCYSSMLSAQENRVMAPEEWEERWQQEKIGFHQPVVHKMLEAHIHKVVAGRTGVKFFFPLCGKAVDMKWLADLGHSVVGVELSEKAIRQFFGESDMSYSEEPVPTVPGAKVFRNAEKTVSLYHSDIYKFSSSLEGQFGAIWDRGALVAINPKDRAKYAALMVSLMAPDCRYLLDTLIYNPQLYKGPPFFVPDEQLLSLFGSSCDVELLKEEDAFTDKSKNWGLDYLTEKVHLLVLKGSSSSSRMLAAQENQVMTLEDWEKMWQRGMTCFHQTTVYRLLEVNIDKVVAGRTGVKFFFPLCGKAVDMKWLAGSGHSVVGVEISEKAIREFFDESGMSYSEEPVPRVPGARVFRNAEKSVSIYQCDVYGFSSSLEGQFGAIWDRGALVAINPKDREKYAALLVSLMAPDCRFLLDTLIYNPERYPGPPFFVPDEQVRRLFGSTCDIEALQEEDALTEDFRNWGMDFLVEKVQLLVRKS